MRGAGWGSGLGLLSALLHPPSPGSQGPMASWTPGPQCPEKEWVQGPQTSPLGDTFAPILPSPQPVPSLPSRCQENLCPGRAGWHLKACLTGPSQQQELGREVTLCQRRRLQQCHPPPGPRGPQDRCSAPQVSVPPASQAGSEGVGGCPRWGSREPHASPEICTSFCRAVSPSVCGARGTGSLVRGAKG